MKIVLASTSKYRKALLDKLQLDFICHKPNVVESRRLNESAKDMALRLAEAKSKDVARHYKSGLIIGSDQTASLHNDILGKPGTPQNAKMQLQQCSGKEVVFYTGLSVVDANSNKCISLVEEYTVCFRNLTDQQIENYIAKESPLDCAGSFKCEGLGISLFSQLQGRDPNSLVGLPLIALCDVLAEFKFDVLS
ncbi:Maf family protein [Aliiglaciecola sp. 3_MG-2023]|uniref:Maf family protein n=1 Tax=Aliiglaciecola sp. 3_MG-2023 TaxID=3062644 RepID=UPI0026E32EB1|nr:Maf family protein [Aliiglaciecola sp. 3_MG-2023]MDO6692475.1 Maf family protein [Aliiglaciecola sp. 3_MG-2023]